MQGWAQQKLVKTNEHGNKAEEGSKISNFELTLFSNDLEYSLSIPNIYKSFPFMLGGDYMSELARFQLICSTV